MAEHGERLVAELRGMRSEIMALTAALEALDRSCVVAEEALLADAAPIDVYRSSRFVEARDGIFAALDRFRDQMTRVRSEGIRLHVDVEGRSLTEVAALTGRSRQYVTRLYRQATGR